MLILLVSLVFVGLDVAVQGQAAHKDIVLDTKRRFVRFVSHEIRTPMNAVRLGMTLFAMEIDGVVAKLADKSSEEVHAVLQEIVADWRRIALDVLDNTEAAIESGSLQLELSNVPVWSVLKRTVATFVLQASIDCEELLCSRERTEHIPDGLPNAVIQRAPVLMLANTRAGAVRITVGDICKEGVQFNVNTLQAGGGSGLGLFIGKYLLVVDDATSNRKLLVCILRGKGFVCREAADGQLALDVYKQMVTDGCTPCAVLMDYEMPVMDGPTATKHLRKLGCDSFIVGVTGNVMQHGANAVLAKPLRVEIFEKMEFYMARLDSHKYTSLQRKKAPTPHLDTISRAKIYAEDNSNV
ncbi:hypothetical protein B484DRAFT_402918 [Ochromonadaceae sp. CCMP2298]|nr:hypothetical protein B484DRAFT_402918 [Ochromonadaceae sp. CCMP2298]